MSQPHLGNGERLPAVVDTLLSLQQKCAAVVRHRELKKGDVRTGYPHAYVDATGRGRRQRSWSHSLCAAEGNTTHEHTKKRGHKNEASTGTPQKIRSRETEYNPVMLMYNHVIFQVIPKIESLLSFSRFYAASEAIDFPDLRPASTGRRNTSMQRGA